MSDEILKQEKSCFSEAQNESYLKKCKNKLYEAS